MGAPARASKCSAATGASPEPHVVAVGGETYTAEHVVHRHRLRPGDPADPGLRELDGVWTSREATALTEIPRRLLVLGAGPVGVEMAQALARLGASVTLVEAGDHVLPREPRALGEAVGEALAADGIELRFGQHASAARRDGDDYVLELADGDELRGDQLLVATGRRPRVDGLGLETVGIEADPHGLPVDARLSLGDGLWAIGDVTGIWPLTYVGKYQGRVVAANILGRVAGGRLRRRPARGLHRSAGGGGGRGRGRLHGDRVARRRPAHGDLHARL